MNDEVSVAELLVREGWGERPPAAHSRWRVVAVMLAVVIGCGTAAVLVAFGSGQVRQDAAPVDQIQVIPMPQRTTGLGGADQATDSPPDGGIGGGTGGDVVPGAHEGTVTEVPGSTSDTESSTESSTPVTPTSETDPNSNPQSTGATTQPSHQPPSTTPTPRKPCNVWLLICLG